MALQLGALRDALMDAGASEDKASKAAEELAGYETRLGRVEGKLTLLLWAVGANVAATLAVFGVLVPISRQLGEILARLH